MHTTYHIFSGSQFHALRERDGFVISASPVMDWAIDLDFKHVRDYCRKKGWKVVPVIEEQQDATTFNYKGDQYILYSDGFKINRITKNDVEITWSELPEQLKAIL